MDIYLKRPVRTYCDFLIITMANHNLLSRYRGAYKTARGRYPRSYGHVPLLRSLVEAERSPSHVPIRSVLGGGDQKKAMGGRLLLLASWEMVSVVDVSGGCGWWVVRRTFS